MQYMLLIYDDEKAWEKMSEAQMTQGMQAYFAFTADVKKNGNHISGEALKPTSTATVVRKKAGKVVTTDGPYAETKEQLGGFYLIEAKDLDEAISIAARIPSVDVVGGAVEVRPVQKFE